MYSKLIKGCGDAGSFALAKKRTKVVAFYEVTGVTSIELDRMLFYYYGDGCYEIEREPLYKIHICPC